ncbi:carboxymuconolactone decarboxylase family protein [Telmatospirillum sp.]|uniref:carboxymuconolactone decarboxylase family protein n=1 Tax=Telmatospirillum sp. TaxID=2079197 RepID=UPI0028479FA2|nr:carboxymuconolactone decarboxylase family protein [Telmatospirillum sp.]MDR3438628.1 carboxymuconolactone decarboxylase family protein [Telmatospirillum sp.]
MVTALDMELVAVAVSVAAGCRPCTTYHLGAARKAGAGEPALEKAIAAAVCVRTSATEGMRRHALGLEGDHEGCGCGAADLWEELASLGASIAVSCTRNIDKHLTAARGLGATPEDLKAVFASVESIRARAISHGTARLESAGLPVTELVHVRARDCASTSSSCC